MAEAVTEPLAAGPDDRRIRGCPRPHLDHPSSGIARIRRTACGGETADRAVLRARSSDSAIRSGRQSDLELGWTGSRLRLAGLESWNHDRLQRQRMDRRQWVGKTAGFCTWTAAGIRTRTERRAVVRTPCIYK